MLFFSVIVNGLCLSYTRFMIHKEFNEGVRLHQWLSRRDIPHTHVANETGGNMRQGVLNKKLGVSAGFPDLLIFLPNGNNVAIELKEPSGKNKATTQQWAWLTLLAKHGFYTSVAFGAEKAIEFLINDCGYENTEHYFKDDLAF